MRSVSEGRAARIAKSDAGAHAQLAHIDDRGVLAVDVELDAKACGLSAGRSNKVVTVLYKVGTVCADGVEPEPLLEAGSVAFVGSTVEVERGATGATMPVYGHFVDLANSDVLMVTRRVRSKVPVILLCLVVAIVVMVAVIMSMWGDPRAKKGYYDGKTKEEIQQDLDEQVAWYAMEISCAGTINVKEGEREVEARIENVVNNHCDQKVRVYPTDDPSDVLFESGAIAPGEYMQTIELKHTLPVGSHALTFEFQGYEQSPTLMSDEGQLFGHDRFGASCAAEVTLNVLPADVTYEESGE